MKTRGGGEGGSRADWNFPKIHLFSVRGSPQNFPLGPAHFHSAGQKPKIFKFQFFIQRINGPSHTPPPGPPFDKIVKQNFPKDC